MSHERYPRISDLKRRAAKRIPHFAWEYLDSGDGDESAVHHNQAAFDAITLTPRFMKGEITPDPSVEIFGVRYDSPVGMAPVGMTGLIWPGADDALAHCAASTNTPYIMSTVSTGSIEEVGPQTAGRGWFQLYPPRALATRADLLKRVGDAGFTTLVVTADVPAASRRGRQRRAGIRVPPRITPKLLIQGALHPAWGLGTIRHGLPRFRSLDLYASDNTMRETAGFVGANLGGTFDWRYLSELRDAWAGPLVVKGILHPDDAERCVNLGIDGIIVSNHGGRQLDAAPPSISALPAIVARIGDRSTVMLDSGIRSGLDAVRAVALGAEMVFSGRSFMFGLGALGARGAIHAAEIFEQEVVIVMHQLGCVSLAEVRDLDRGVR